GLPLLPVVGDEAIGDARLARAGAAGDADHVGVPRVRAERAEHLHRLGQAAVEVAHQPRGGAHVAAADALGDRLRLVGDLRWPGHGALPLVEAGHPNHPTAGGNRQPDLLEDLAADDQALDLRGTLADLAELGVAQVALDREL